ncbi:MAG: hypothetical protein OHK0046_18400 [Anaerolineae bacterium]
MRLTRFFFAGTLTIMAVLLAAVSFAVTAQGATLAPEGTSGETYYAPFPVNITLDGEFNDWNGVPQVYMGQGVGRPAMSFAAAADAEFLYLWGDIIDTNIITGQHGENYWNEDSVEFYLNGTGDFTRSSYTDGIAQLTLPPLNIGAAPEDVVIAGVRGATLEAQVVTVQTDTGWAVEVAVPLESAVWSITPEHEGEMGLQVHLNAAAELNRDSKLIWSIFDPGDQSYQNPSLFGRLIFYEVASAPVVSGEYFFRSELAESGLVDDFENGLWMDASGSGLIGMVPSGAAQLALQQILSESASAVPDQESPANNVLVLSTTEGGSYTHYFTDGLNTITQDWSAYNALGLWLQGEGAAGAEITLHNGEAVYTYALNEIPAAWQYIVVPFDLFASAGDAVFDPAAVSGYGVTLTGEGTLHVDDVTLFLAENTTAAIESAAAPEATFIVDESIDWDSRTWTLLWSDEFEGEAGTAINTENWTCEIGGHGWGNNELEYYTDSLENVSHTGDGFLQITAMQGQPESGETCWYGQCAYTSARCITRDKVEFTYGRVEARLQIPFGQGIWPAFWMLGANFDAVGWPNSGEIDIMENIGSEPRTVHGTIHGPGYSGASGIGNSISRDADFADDFHVYAIDWDPNVIRWYVDGELFSTISVNDLRNREWVYDHDFFLLMNVAVGGAWPGFPNETTTFPQQMLVDYVRVYQLAP